MQLLKRASVHHLKSDVGACSAARIIHSVYQSPLHIMRRVHTVWFAGFCFLVQRERRQDMVQGWAGVRARKEERQVAAALGKEGMENSCDTKLDTHCSLPKSFFF